VEIKEYEKRTEVELDQREHGARQLSTVNQDPALPLGHTVTVKTYAGPNIKCKIIAIRRLKSGIAYDVVPLEDKSTELKRSGVPQDRGSEQFVAFDFQIIEQPAVPVGEPITRSSPTTIRRKQAAVECTSMR
jgi:hypothetical protein